MRGLVGAGTSAMAGDRTPQRVPSLRSKSAREPTWSVDSCTWIPRERPSRNAPADAPIAGQNAEMTDDPALWSATRQAEAIRSKELSSRELLDTFAARIERLNPAVNAVVTLDLERGRKAA